VWSKFFKLEASLFLIKFSIHEIQLQNEAKDAEAELTKKMANVEITQDE
jgi:hypothetical protein